MVSERILVVEDEESVSITLRGILEQAGYVAAEAQSLSDALRQLDRDRAIDPTRLRRALRAIDRQSV